jgi:biofilm PGA synthesis N-glycosyltransferase PgaC
MMDGSGACEGPRYRVSAVVPAYNEERNIAHMLASLLAQRTALGVLSEVVVVASGCTDATAAHVSELARRDERVRLVLEAVRSGKAAAVDRYLEIRDPDADIVLIASADVLLSPGFLDEVLRAFAADPRVGMCGGRPVPSNDARTLMGRVGALLWELHHEVATVAPKLGEAIAVRAALVPRLPADSVLDEATIEAMVTAAGQMLKYLPEAIVVNRGPDTVLEYLWQRRRNAAGHYTLRAQTGYRVATLPTRRLIILAARRLRAPARPSIVTCAVAVLLEVAARFLGRLDVLRGRSHAVWKVAPTAHAALGHPDTPPHHRAAS